MADASASEPWIGLPTTGLTLTGTVDIDSVRGVLVVENKDTFQKVCQIPEVVERWLCVWGKGYTSSGMIALLSRFVNRPIAAWCDLDADGIQIVVDLARRLARPVSSVGMTVSLWETGPWRRQNAEQLRRGQQLAGVLADTDSVDLRDLAAAITLNGEGREQESMYEDFLPHLAKVLAGLS
ncbi:Wadjet anti-phage system protein JetD domain-containing protein [Actinokineospora inagensis]|uniref:Wadjet anti-phage system protein JetD domain-containing protein n=1 Tax=Actinokineospora inagensis TaxID=103730 RepID=UPI00146FA220|nr:Wadjet anti-phage system protein JetD domain-containing protein [Actinokineospora inagensis]